MGLRQINDKISIQKFVDGYARLSPEVSGMTGGPHQSIAYQQLDRSVTPKELHALRRHPAHVWNVANFVALGPEEKAVRHVVFPVEDGKGGDLQPSHLRNKTKVKRPV